MISAFFNILIAQNLPDFLSLANLTLPNEPIYHMITIKRTLLRLPVPRVFPISKSANFNLRTDISFLLFNFN